MKPQRGACLNVDFEQVVVGRGNAVGTSSTHKTIVSPNLDSHVSGDVTISSRSLRC